eukprot:CAMPEP_0201644654 /NCGR_PEP_ID=MMETSP0493-20130528/30644_1 /ASSEMBLY_ACC=CAM_ASM_000838 /TAXON_ID=420259 /ORGANISM="Thalassiosira gravida, Strain GMp14c1" /LENGTH=126 /DNA_ID=CAMNT_0048119415 /DNA_START=285 /DNA_END=666 /DNA_ORIENTATION=+
MAMIMTTVVMVDAAFPPSSFQPSASPMVSDDSPQSSPPSDPPGDDPFDPDALDPPPLLLLDLDPLALPFLYLDLSLLDFPNSSIQSFLSTLELLLLELLLRLDVDLLHLVDFVLPDLAQEEGWLDG